MIIYRAGNYRATLTITRDMIFNSSFVRFPILTVTHTRTGSPYAQLIRTVYCDDRTSKVVTVLVITR